VVQPDGRWTLGAAVGGTIRDQNGAVIPGATVALTTSGVNYFSVTSENGTFRFEQLTAGNYMFMVEAPGFSRAELNIYLEPDSDRQVDQTLQVADIHADVDVSSHGMETHTVVSGGAMIATPTNPFVKAAFEDNLEELTRLIAETDVNVSDEATDTTALDHAVGNGNREIMQLLLSRGAKVTGGPSPILMRLDDDATSDLVWDLINAGAEVNAKTETGETPLMSAAYEQNGEILKTLLDAGADVDSKNEDGQTALMMAAEHGKLQNVRALVLAGADINQIDGEGKNALMLAIENEHRTVIRFLRSKGAIESVTPATVEE
jgi:ankyrin repeat protein